MCHHSQTVYEASGIYISSGAIHATTSRCPFHETVEIIRRSHKVLHSMADLHKDTCLSLTGTTQSEPSTGASLETASAGHKPVDPSTGLSECAGHKPTPSSTKILPKRTEIYIPPPVLASRQRVQNDPADWVKIDVPILDERRHTNVKGIEERNKTRDNAAAAQEQDVEWVLVSRNTNV